MSEAKQYFTRMEAAVSAHDVYIRNASAKHPNTDVSELLLREAAALANRSRYARRGVPISDTTIRVLLVDDHAVLRGALRALLKSAPDIQIVGEAANGHEAIAVAQRCAPDVVVMDLDMPGGDGATATRALMQFAQPPKVLILTMHTEEERLVPLLKDGAQGFLSKECSDAELIDAIRVVASGEFFVRPAVARILAANAVAHRRPTEIDDDRKRLELLSVRERSVLQHIAEGYSGVEIGRMLGITPKSIDTYKNRISEKLGFTHRTDYVRFALRLALIGEHAAQGPVPSEHALRM